MKNRQEIEIQFYPIRLGQFLKIANLVQDGIEAKMRIQNGEIEVNGNVETRRGKQLQSGDTISTSCGHSFILK